MSVGPRALWKTPNDLGGTSGRFRCLHNNGREVIPVPVTTGTLLKELGEGKTDLRGIEQENEGIRKTGKGLRSNKGIGRKVAKETGGKVRD